MVFYLFTYAGFGDTMESLERFQRAEVEALSHCTFQSFLCRIAHALREHRGPMWSRMGRNPDAPVYEERKPYQESSTYG